ncbi:MAG: L-glutamate gamma-semialdehyde dehydrogenase [Candidatus Thermoplasmatota archaeon]
MLWSIEKPENEMERLVDYSPGSEEREELKKELDKIKEETVELPVVIDGDEIKTGNIEKIRCPHDHDDVLGRVHLAREEELEMAVEAAEEAHEDWTRMNWYHRAAVFRKAADLLAGPRRFENIAAIIMNQSKNPYEAEIDLAELVDFWRLNAYYMRFIYEQQPDQIEGEMNRLDWRPLEGFVLAISPFNFYSIAGNLPASPAIVGNTVIWKPSLNVSFSNYQIMKVWMEAGLEEGVINFVPFPSDISETLTEHPDLAGLNFTGSYDTLTYLWKVINSNIKNYRNFPRIVGEAGGKDFIFIHKSADVNNVAVNMIRGSFGYQGQKCSASSRVYCPESKWDEVEEILDKEISEIKCGPVDDLRSYMGAVIDEAAFKKIVSYIEYAEENESYQILYGGGYDSTDGWFIEPTVVKTDEPKGKLMTEEIFGPVLPIYVYPDGDFEETLRLCDQTSPYALTGSIFAKDSEAIHLAEEILRYSAGNFYINDKPTGAVVGRQPFGGSRASGTNDKAGYWTHLLRWLSPRSIKETILPAEDWRREFMPGE